MTYIITTCNYSDEVVNTVYMPDEASLHSWMRLMAARNMSTTPFKAVFIMDEKCHPVFITKGTKIITDEIGGEL